MIVLLIAVLVVVAGLAAAAVIGRLPVDGMDDATSTSSYEGLADGPVEATDLGRLRFDQVLRGYRMEQVDGVLDRVRDALAERDREIEQLRARLPAEGADARGRD